VFERLLENLGFQRLVSRDGNDLILAIPGPVAEHLDSNPER
jgi:hypothetical protein